MKNNLKLSEKWGLESFLGDSKRSGYDSTKLNFDQHLKSKQAAHQIFKLDIQVFFDSQPCVRNGFIQIRIQVSKHLQGKYPVAECMTKKHDYILSSTTF